MRLINSTLYPKSPVCNKKNHFKYENKQNRQYIIKNFETDLFYKLQA